ncbi:MAG TPA: substrate-binding domain-containing protein [Gaiellaceae bacterium]|nr:substrate-binding domain-containing protein [Gaiellaceae bacterium]
MRSALVVLLATALLGASCTGDDEPAADDASPLTIFASSSLEGVFRELAPDADFRFGSSDELAGAALDGEIPDVFASAGQGPIAEVGVEGVLESPAVFATNRLVLVVPAQGSDAGSLADLAGAEVLVGAELDSVRSALEAIGGDDLLENAGFEPDAAEQVASGSADAALVYYTDALAAGEAVRVIELPAQALVQYPIAVANVSESFEEAQAFVELLLSDRGRQALEEAGFTLPPAG